MTIEKAIEQLESLMQERESKVQRDDFDDIFLQDIEACKAGIQALERLIPKKVKREFTTENGCITCFEAELCPVCGEDFYVEYLRQVNYCNFCTNCGQALDWSDNDE